MKLQGIHRPVAFVLWALSFLFAILIPVCFVYGFPIPFLERSLLHVKNTRKLFELCFIFFSLGLAVHPKRKELILTLKQKADERACSPWALWILTGVYFLLFLWQQITKYLALEINFIPALFFDYMLWYFNQGKICYTGLLHGYYHLNLIMLLFYPFWKIVKSSWILYGADPLIAAAAAIPFFYWTREQLKNPLLALIATFVYLNFRYLQNLLLINFVVEVFYPLFILSAVYFASQKKEGLYYLSVLLGLLVKEDSAIYFGALGLFFLFLPSYRRRGFWTVILSTVYLVFLLKIFLPWSGNNILRGDVANYKALGSTTGGVTKGLLQHPWFLIRELFLPLEKVKTFFKLTSRLLFFPLFSPWFALVIASLYPLFFQSTHQGHSYFYQLSFHYAAAVLPFLFLAFVDGWRRLNKTNFFRKRPFLREGMVAALIFLNGMNFRPFHFTRDGLKTIALAKSLPKDSVVVTQGHLLPYLGYRKWNFYISEQYELRKDTQQAYQNPDYFLFDLCANAYPLSSEELRQKAETLKKNPKFRILYQDHRRLLFESIQHASVA